jgi:NADPH:quinone reductase-like Zn-dependent oxidoreductase
MFESRAMLLTAPGAPLELHSRTLAAPARGEAIVRLAATSLNNHDLLGLNGLIRGALYPRVPFSDGCGEVVAVGDGVTEVQVGERVLPNFFARWIGGPPTPQALSVVYGDQVDGCLQTHGRFDAASLVLAPAHLSDIEAATLPCAGLTAWRSLMVDGKVRAGDVVVAQGTGGVALFALGVGKMVGATVIITSSSDEKLERVKALGADHTINYARENWPKRVLEITGGRGADHILDIGGPQTLPAAVRAAALDGFISVIGMLTGEEMSALPLRPVMSKNLTVKGLTVGSRADLAAFARAVSTAAYRPVVDQAFAMDETPDAVAAMSRHGRIGKLAIRIDS